MSKNRTLHENLNDHEKVECPICNSEIQPYHVTMELEQLVKSVELIGRSLELKHKDPLTV